MGVAGLISPWNLPLYLLTFKVLAWGKTFQDNFDLADELIDTDHIIFHKWKRWNPFLYFPRPVKKTWLSDGLKLCVKKYCQHCHFQMLMLMWTDERDFKMAPALMAGNTVVCKPSEMTRYKGWSICVWYQWPITFSHCRKFFLPM